MRANTASWMSFKSAPIEIDQIEEESMEARVARIESDVAHIKDNIQNINVEMREFRGDLKAANESITQLSRRVEQIDGKIDRSTAELKGAMGAGEARLDGRIDSLESRIDSKISDLETRLIKWIVGTAIATTTAGFSIAKFFSY